VSGSEWQFSEESEKEIVLRRSQDEATTKPDERQVKKMD